MKKGMRAMFRKGDDTREKVYKFICQYWRDNISSPGFRDIGDGCGIVPSHVFRVLRQLQEQGKIMPRRARIARNIVPTRVYNAIYQSMGEE